MIQTMYLLLDTFFHCPKHNDMLYNNTVTEKGIIHSCDAISGSTSEQAKAKCLILVEMSEKYADKNGLLCELLASIDLIYAITINIKTDDGLSNGAACVLKKYNI